MLLSGGYLMVGEENASWLIHQVVLKPFKTGSSPRLGSQTYYWHTNSSSCLRGAWPAVFLGEGCKYPVCGLMMFLVQSSFKNIRRWRSWATRIWHQVESAVFSKEEPHVSMKVVNELNFKTAVVHQMKSLTFCSNLFYVAEANDTNRPLGTYMASILVLAFLVHLSHHIRKGYGPASNVPVETIPEKFLRKW